MKYLRKFIAFLLGVVLFAAVVISIGMIYAVKNINVELITYAEDYSGDYAKAKNSLSTLKGESIIFIGKEDVENIVADSNFKLSSFEKIYPCTINVTLEERLETFAVLTGVGYSFYDNDGKFLRKGTENININDDSPNVELTGVSAENIENIASIAAFFKDKFKSLRTTVTSISLETNPDVEGFTDKLVFNMRCGVKIRIEDYTKFTEEKIDAVYKKFCTLTDRQKLCGVVRGYSIGGDDGIINADYSTI